MSAVPKRRVRSLLTLSAAAAAVTLVLTACASTAQPGAGGGTTAGSSSSASSEPTTASSAPTTASSESSSPSPSSQPSATPSPKSGAATLEGTQWTLVEATGKDGKALDDVASVASTLAFEDGRIAVYGGCNNGGAEVTVGDTELEVGPMMMTAMACADENVTAVETLVTQVYDGTVTYELADDTLTITGDAGTLVYQAASAGPAGSSMAFVLESATDGAGKKVDLGGIESTLELSGNEITFFSGCNNGGGSITVAGDTVTFGPMRMTMMACTGPADDIEKVLLAVLDGTATFTTDGTKLTVANDGGTLVYGPN